MKTILMRGVLICVAALLSGGCATHSTSKDWNGLMGPDGKPAYYKTTSKVAVKLLIVIPFVGNVSIDGMIDDLTEEIAEENADNVRIVQASSENYWYGYPPFSWIVTPVINTVSAQYTPEQEAYLKDQETIKKKESSWQKYNPMEL